MTYLIQGLKVITIIIYIASCITLIFLAGLWRRIRETTPPVADYSQ